VCGRASLSVVLSKMTVMSGRTSVSMGAAGGHPGVCLVYVDAAGVEQRVDLTDAAMVRWETCRAARPFVSYRGQVQNPGLWWSSTMSGHLGYGSWAEKDQVMALDFDPRVVAFAPRPFLLCWARERSCAPSVRRPYLDSPLNVTVTLPHPKSNQNASLTSSFVAYSSNADNDSYVKSRPICPI
jgi:hypothetical protein